MLVWVAVKPDRLQDYLALGAELMSHVVQREEFHVYLKFREKANPSHFVILEGYRYQTSTHGDYFPAIKKNLMTMMESIRGTRLAGPSVGFIRTSSPTDDANEDPDILVPENAVGRVFSARVMDEKMDEFLALSSEDQEQVKSEAGVLVYLTWRESKRPDYIVRFEVFVDDAAAAAHRAAASRRGFDVRLQKLLVPESITSEELVGPSQGQIRR